MPRYHLYNRTAGVSTPALAGFQQFSNLEQACALATESLRSKADQALAAGQAMTIEAVEIITESGELLFTLLASDALSSEENG
jgi:hypothetical protein